MYVWKCIIWQLLSSHWNVRWSTFALFVTALLQPCPRTIFSCLFGDDPLLYFLPLSHMLRSPPSRCPYCLPWCKRVRISHARRLECATYGHATLPMTIDADTFAFSDISVPVAKVRGDLRYMRSTPSDRAFLKRDASVSENVPYFFFFFPRFFPQRAVFSKCNRVAEVNNCKLWKGTRGDAPWSKGCDVWLKLEAVGREILFGDVTMSRNVLAWCICPLS